jgi:hypothetical protein
MKSAGSTAAPLLVTEIDHVLGHGPGRSWSLRGRLTVLGLQVRGIVRQGTRVVVSIGSMAVGVAALGFGIAGIAVAIVNCESAQRLDPQSAWAPTKTTSNIKVEFLDPTPIGGHRKCHLKWDWTHTSIERPR